MKKNNHPSATSNAIGETEEKLLAVSNRVRIMLRHSTTKDLFTNGSVTLKTLDNITYNRIPSESANYHDSIVTGAIILRSISNQSGDCHETAHLAAFMLSRQINSTENIFIVTISNKQGDDHCFASYTDSHGEKWDIDPWNEQHPVIRSAERASKWDYIYNRYQEPGGGRYRREIENIDDPIWESITEDKLEHLGFSLAEIGSTLDQIIQCTPEQESELVNNIQKDHAKAAARAYQAAEFASKQAKDAQLAVFIVKNKTHREAVSKVDEILNGADQSPPAFNEVNNSTQLKAKLNNFIKFSDEIFNELNSILLAVGSEDITGLVQTINERCKKDLGNIELTGHRNHLTLKKLNPLSGGARYKDTLTKIEKTLQKYLQKTSPQAQTPLSSFFKIKTNAQLLESLKDDLSKIEYHGVPLTIGISKNVMSRQSIQGPNNL